LLSSYAQGVFFIWELYVNYRLFFSFYFLLLTLIVLLINEVTDISADSYTPSPFLSLTQSFAEPISCVLSATYLSISLYSEYSSISKIHPPRSASIFLSHLHLICIAFYLS